MPTYVYECSKCNERFEVEQRITESSLDTCPCGSVGAVKRIIQPAGIMFKGAGFHINDYSAKPASNEQPAAAPATEATTEAKPAAEPATPSETKNGETPTS